MVPYPVYIRPYPPAALPGSPEEAPAQGMGRQELFAPAYLGDHRPDLGGMDRLGQELGISQKGEDAVIADGHYPVQHILSTHAPEEDHVAFFHSAIGKIQENRVPGV